MLLEQVLHIMLNQDYPRSVIISTANICTFALRCISENGKYGKKVMQTFAKPLLSTDNRNNMIYILFIVLLYVWFMKGSSYIWSEK